MAWELQSAGGMCDQPVVPIGGSVLMLGASRYVKAGGELVRCLMMEVHWENGGLT